MTIRIDKGRFSSMKELAEKEGIAESYVRRMMRLNYLSPKIKEMIIDGKQPKHLKLQDFMGDIPMLWAEQEEMFLR
jgi:site-specific DNA recombinase